MSRQSPPLLLLDFDGTVCLGDDPVLAYAEATVRGLPATEATRILDTVRAYLNAELGPRWADGYLAVKELTTGLVTEDTRSAAYAESRHRLEADELNVTTPDGLHGFLGGLEGVAERVLVTNAPLEGVSGVLDRLGLAPLLDRVLPSAHKPDGWEDLLPRALNGRAAAEAVSVGDVYRNDLAPLIPHGVATAFIDRFTTPGLPIAPTWTASGFPELYADLDQWLRTVAQNGRDPITPPTLQPTPPNQ
jgi:FMN phosphatase YigB (HAD superfamily)